MKDLDDFEELDDAEDLEDDDDNSDFFYMIACEAIDGNDDALNMMYSFADEGHQDIQYVLGCMYLLGRGVEEDKEEAEMIFLDARADGNDDATFMLAVMAGDEGDYKTALSYVIEAAKNGQEDAQELAANFAQKKRDNPEDFDTCAFLKAAFDNKLASAFLDLRDLSRVFPA